MSLSGRLKTLQREFGVKQGDFVQILKDSGVDITVSAIKGMFQGRTQNLKPSYAIILAKYFKINRDWLESGVGNMRDKNEKEIVSLNDLSAIANSLNKNAVQIPFYEDIRASAGTGCINGECEPTYIQLVPELLPTRSKEVDAIRVHGDSMSNTVDDGDIIFVDKNDNGLINGKIYVVYLCEEVYVKRVFKDPSGTNKFILKSDNPVYPQFDVACDDFRVIGRVVGNMNIKKL